MALAPLDAAPLYAWPPAKGAKALLKKLRLDHREPLSKFVIQALDALPKEPAVASVEEPTLELLKSAGEAARLVLWLDALPSPNGERYSYNVAARCQTLRQYAMAAQMSAVVVRSLHEKGAASQGASSKSAPSIPAV